ncbi:bifunctional DNA-formamidopyrimidine glycosylase/DNA-(apurinic or apyrimidinic site) lyase [Plastoroseomonas arctica]|uniref:Formamidopyrimidine-DNA glycosylase n=1 Tax=Plastoroseomonas arctica TaxID=1509237 RepID=A0AAF1KUX5_9PROT|nr:bifunctional DNA-formamidopyrimidine glycosylase/DNA-(apurinic or apyrimidinic site) lyase [Plastoroseomonas arctica]MBR0657342.1 bifunctional DNA-formamidopyrimidine glycosylase/DNA-(apurinic or apyrimidinic site) lyase [Plastoroseomonas arctica]
MPELPEVETVMRGLATVLEGSRISRVAVNRAGMRWPFPVDLAVRLEGARVLGFARRAKYMLMRLDTGQSALIHLGMSGRMVARRLGVAPVPRGAAQGAYSDARGHNQPPEAHEHLVIENDAGWRVGFVDPRRFGSVDLVATAAEGAHRLLRDLGPEPLEEAFSAAALSARIGASRTPIKSALLDQRVVAGLGNIYVCEALFRAGISPRRLAYTVAGARAAKLVPAIKAVLAESIAAGGSSLRDYVRADGELGVFQESFLVYGREGEACIKCGAACPGIRRIVQAGRSTFFCARQQR